MGPFKMQTMSGCRQQVWARTSMMSGDSVGEGFHQHRILVWDAVQLLDVLGSAGLLWPVSVPATQAPLLNVAKQRCHMPCSGAAALVTARRRFVIKLGVWHRTVLQKHLNLGSS